MVPPRRQDRTIAGARASDLTAIAQRREETLGKVGVTWRSAVDEPVAWLARHGWRSAHLDAAALSATFGRDVRPVLDPSKGEAPLWLLRRGLVRRAVNARDKRSYRIELTAQGVEVQREHRRVSRLISRKMLEALPTAEERSQFVELFRRIAAHI